MMALLAGLRALGPVKLGAMALVALLSLALVGLLAVRCRRGADGPALRRPRSARSRPDRRPIGQGAHPAPDRTGGSRILVPADQVARARLLLAKDGLPSGGSIGYEIFDRADGLTANAFQQGINQTRALEGELSRTIRSIQGVRAARVHLVLPQREPFARERQEAQASVVLTMAGAARLDREGVQAVLNLIAAAVPGLQAAEHRHGRQPRQPARPRRAADRPGGRRADRRGAEARHRAAPLPRRRGDARAQPRARAVSAPRPPSSSTSTRSTRPRRRFDPDGQVVRSQQSSTDNSRNTEASAATSPCRTTCPTPTPARSRPASQEQKQEETTNYEISKTVRTVVREQPQMRRISLAVMVDGVVDAAAPTARAWSGPRRRGRAGPDRHPGPQRDRLQRSARRPGRGREHALRRPRGRAEPPPPPFWAQLDKADLFRLAENGLLGLAVLAGAAVRAAADGAAPRRSAAASRRLAGRRAARPATLAGPAPAADDGAGAALESDADGA